MITQTIDTSARTVPALGGFNLTMLGIELRRMLRNRRTVIFTLIMPVVLYLIIGASDTYSKDGEGSGNVSAYILISMAVYGAVLAATSGGAMVANERALGWSRQLRLTPLSPVAYIATKAVVALAFGGLSVVAVNIVGKLNGKAEMPAHVWVAAALIATGKPVSIEGYTDSKGSRSSNMDLSQRRAESVRSYLISRGFPANQVVAKGMGPDRPIAENSSAEGRANNRRVEIVVAKLAMQPN